MRTEQEKKAWKEKMSALAKNIKAMTKEQRTAFANKSPVFTCEGHVLSTWNTCYVIMQHPTATQVGGIRQWNKIGRKVIKDEHACASIMVPMVHKKAESEDPDVNFKFVPVFDVTQTEMLAK